MISVVIPALIVSDDLLVQAKKAIESVKTANTEIIVVDNGSIFGQDWLKDNSNIYIRYPNPIGFGRACNQGIKLSTGDYIAILSVDNEYLVGNLDTLTETYVLDGKIGVICPSMANKGQQRVEKLFIDSTEGSTFLLSRSVYDKIKLPEGLYDERYEYGYFEDADLWKRLRNAGFILARSGQVLANHHEGTTSKFLGVLEKYMEINKKKYIEKWKEEPTWTG